MQDTYPDSDDQPLKDRPGFLAGFVAIAGKPNVGKSTLMNALVGVKLSAVSRRPQTTRNEIKGILTAPGFQIVFLDTPGLIQPDDRLNAFLLAEASKALEDVDLLYHLVEPNDPNPLDDVSKLALASIDCPKFLLINKIDRVEEDKRISKSVEALTDNYDEVLRISALNGIGLDDLLKKTVARLPEHPPYYEEDELTDRDARFLVAEIVREKLFELTRKEVPYSIATQVEEFRERPDRKDFIRVVIYVERESQKGLIVGKGGERLKKAGELARADIEELLGESVYLDLWVKVRKKWRKNETELRRLGYSIPKKKKRGGPARVK